MEATASGWHGNISLAKELNKAEQPDISGHVRRYRPCIWISWGACRPCIGVCMFFSLVPAAGSCSGRRESSRFSSTMGGLYAGHTYQTCIGLFLFAHCLCW